MTRADVLTKLADGVDPRVVLLARSYLKDGSIKAAGDSVGMRPGTAVALAKTPEFKIELADAVRRRAARTGIDLEWVVLELAAVCRAAAEQGDYKAAVLALKTLADLNGMKKPGKETSNELTIIVARNENDGPSRADMARPAELVEAPA